MPFEASARCSSGLTPAPIIVRASSNATGATSWRARIDIERVDQVGRGVDSVPSRSNTMVGAGMARALARARGRRQGAAVRGPAYLKALPPQAVPAMGSASNPRVAAFHECRDLQTRGRRRRARFRAARHAARARHRLDRAAVRRTARRARARRASTSSRCRPRRRRGSQAEQCGIPLTTLDETPELDLTIDGADEIAPDLALSRAAAARCCARRSSRRRRPAWW